MIRFDKRNEIQLLALFDKKIALPRLDYITDSLLSNEYEKINLMVNYLSDEDTALNSRALKLLYFYYQIYENQKDNKKYKITRESIKILCQKKHNYFNTPFNDFIENEIKPEIRKEQLDNNNNIRGF